MPLVETVSLLTALASAYQSMRASRSSSETAVVTAVEVPEPALLLSHEIARASYDSSLERARELSWWALVVQAFASFALLIPALTILAFEAGLDITAWLFVAVTSFAAGRCGSDSRSARRGPDRPRQG